MHPNGHPGARHPRDPEPVPSTKAAAAFTLSVVAVITSPFLGGVIPAALALRLSAQASSDIAASEGFLLGAKRCLRARRLAYIAFSVAVFTVLALAMWWLYLDLTAEPIVK
ncbi:MAG TPA: hypothetical protein VE172_02440 [Stackebrandtia sp.]|uniref:hypothetical protein n=1 Tax=Stackebrandtia sp. TaxID=2023065 RepID=UPI002D5A208D|nr:hypothetical protein [Stackebrandtia sp.]HZE37646.1 hypothetical protein [Stackebrandtia sp.]